MRCASRCSQFYRSYWFLIIWVSLFGTTSCKDKRQEHEPQSSRAEEIARATETISQFSADAGAEDSQASLEHSVPQKDVQVIDLSKVLDSDEEIHRKTFDASKRTLLSQYPADEDRLFIRANLQIRGIGKSKYDEFEERLWHLLYTHLPQPWELKTPSQIDKHDEVWGRLDVQFKKQTHRVKRVSKTAPMRVEYNYTLTMRFYGPRDLTAVWDDWEFSWHDEVPVGNESGVDAQFWQNIALVFPTFTATDLEQTAQWMRSQGLMPQILTKGLKALHAENHQYYPNGCVLSSDKSDGKRSSLRQLQSLYTPPQLISIPNVASIYCGREATFVVAAETPVKLALYYQPVRGTHAWKSQMTFQDAMVLEDIGLHVDETLVCLYTANRSQQQRGFEIQCLDRKTGLMKWQTKRFSGGLRGFGSDEQKLVMVNDQAVLEISRQGEVLGHQLIETSSRLRRRYSCQLQNRLIFMPGPGQFAAWNLETSEFDWQVNVIESDFIHCGQNHTFIFSEVGGYLLAYDVQNQTPLWKYRAVSMPRDAWSYADDIYFLFDRAVIVLDRVTGHKKAQIPLPWLATSFIQNGRKLYLDSADAIYEWR